MLLTPQTIRDILGVLAVILIGIGCGMWWLPAGPMAAGVALLTLVVVGTIRAPVEVPAVRPERDERRP